MKMLLLLTLLALPVRLAAQDWSQLERADSPPRPSWAEILAGVPESQLGKLPEISSFELCSEPPPLPDSVALTAPGPFMVDTWESGILGPRWGIVFGESIGDTIRVRVGGMRRCMTRPEVFFEKDSVVFSVHSTAFRRLPFSYESAFNADKTTDEIEREPRYNALSGLDDANIEVFLIREDGQLELAFWEDPSSVFDKAGGFAGLQAYVEARDAAILAKRADEESAVRQERADREARIRSRGWSAQVTDAVLGGRISIGMTADMVTEAWGSPRRKNRTTTANATREQWVYSSGQYVYLEGGIVTSIQTSR